MKGREGCDTMVGEEGLEVDAETMIVPYVRCFVRFLIEDS